MEEIFEKCESSIYHLQMTEHANFHKFVVSKNSAATREYFVQLPKVHNLGLALVASLRRKAFPATIWLPLSSQAQYPI